MMDKNNIIQGKVYVLGDNIDTDLIIPAQYLNLVPTIPKEYKKLGSYALAGLPDSYEKFVEHGKFKSIYSIIIAGKNFGCGSSREHAPIALGAAGIKAVVAQSYARIFFRNAVATGKFYPIESDEQLCAIFKTGDEAMIDISKNLIKHMLSGKEYALRNLGAVKSVIEAGGLFGYARKEGMISSKPAATKKRKKNTK